MNRRGVDEREVDEDGFAAEVRRAIEVANREDGSAEQVARLAARIAPIIGLPAAPSGLESSSVAHGAASSAKVGAAVQGTSGWAVSKLLVLKVSLALGGITGASLLGAQLMRPDAVPPREAAPSEQRAQHSHGPSSAAEAADAPLQPGPRTSAAQVERATPARAATAAVNADLLTQEAALLQRARALLVTSPAAALQETERHRSRFPRGALREEREALAIRALLRLDDRTAAAHRFGQFVRAFPGSLQRSALAKQLSSGRAP